MMEELCKLAGKCGGCFVTDLADLIEDPSRTALSPAENIKRHWFNDASHSYTAELTDAFHRGIIGEALYRELMSSDVYYGCSDDGAPKTAYTIVCPCCAETFRLLLPEPYTAVGGVIPSCPFCGKLLLSVQPMTGAIIEIARSLPEPLPSSTILSSVPKLADKRKKLQPKMPNIPMLTAAVTSHQILTT